MLIDSSEQFQNQAIGFSNSKGWFEMGLEILLLVHYSIAYFIKRAGILYLSCLDQYITFLKFLADDGTIQSGMQTFARN